MEKVAVSVLEASRVVMPPGVVNAPWGMYAEMLRAVFVGMQVNATLVLSGAGVHDPNTYSQSLITTYACICAVLLGALGMTTG